MRRRLTQHYYLWLIATFVSDCQSPFLTPGQMMKTNSSKNENYFICFYTLHFLWNKQAQKFLLFKKKTIKFSFFNSSKTINQSTPLPTVNCSWSRTTVAWSVLGHQGSNIAEAYSYQQTMEHNEGILSRNSMKLIHNFNKW